MPFALISLSICFFLSSTFAADCNKWFIHWKLKPGPSCIDLCQNRGIGGKPEDMECAAQCRKLCDKALPDKPFYSGKTLAAAGVYYPGLNPTEKELIKENPMEAFKVFLQKNTAESETSHYFPKGGFNDESDAFRHYIWAGLLTDKLGAERAKIYLDAHENDPAEPQRAANSRG
jgi:hypothetical protein